MGALHQAMLMTRQLATGGSPAAGSLLIALSGDIEPTGGSAPRWFDSISGGTPTTVTTPTGVHDHAWSTTSGARGIVNLPASVLAFSAGQRFYVTSDSTHTILRFYDGASGEHVEIGYVAGGNFRVTRNAGATQLAISTGAPISLNTQYYVEITAVVNDTTGSFTCKLYNDSGTLLDTLTASGVDTRDGATSVTAVVLGLTGYFEDFWYDDSGQLYGPIQVETTGPNGAGALTQLTRGGTDSGANWSQVEEKPVVTTDYNASTSTDQIDTYTFAARSVTGTPKAAGVSMACATSTGTATFKAVVRIAGVNYEHSTTYTATTSAKFYGAFWQNNPATGFAWTDADINSAEFGIKWIQTNGRIYGLYRTTLVAL